MKKQLYLAGCLLAIILLASCQLKKGKSYDVTKPVDMIEALSNDVADGGDEWTKEDWEDAADNLEAAIKNLPDPLADDETTIVESAVSRMTVYAERHKRKAASLLSVLGSFKPKAQAQEQSVPSIKAQKAAAPAAAAAPAGLLSGNVIQEGGYTNVRKGPGTSYEIVNKIKDGSPIYYTVYNGNWCVVYDNAGNMMGYMHSSKVIPGGQAAAPARGVVKGTPYDWLASRYVTAQDLAGLDAGQLRVLRNAIYARHGRLFKDVNLRQYFNSQSWYNGYRNEIPANELNKYETYNIQFIQKYE